MNMPLSFSPIAATSSADETEALFREQLVASRIMQVKEDSEFGVQMNGIQIGSAALSCIQHQTDYEIDCGDIENDESVIFGYGFGQSSSTSFNGDILNINDHGVIITKSSNVSHKRKSGSYEFVVNSTLEAVEQKLQTALNRHTSKQLAFDQTILMETSVGLHAKSTISYVVQSLDANPELQQNSLAVANFEELLLGTILSLPSNFTEELNNQHALHTVPKVVKRAESFIEENACTPITMSDVLIHVDCGRNALFKNFQKFRGYTPWEFLVTTRLKLAHQRLRTATQNDTVTSIAHSLGFTHMGRFSIIYRKRYGEKPSETLKQSLI